MSAKPAVRVTGAGRRGRLWRAGPAAAGLAAVGLLTVACSSSPASPGVASAPSSSASATPSATSSGSGGLAFAACMRSHGVPNFYYSPGTPPASSSGAVLSILGHYVTGVNPRTTEFATASKACKHLLPGGGGRSAMTQQQINGLLRFAACMRAHGYPDYPDPVVQNGGVIEKPLPGDIDISSPEYQAAEKTCNAST